ncbi:hypothetical protein [Roseibium marinum]|uniref:Uncharacterized protein n=1 Tax=Roseibium marinum TaxID=281252 RepID=A0A2S3UK12_9HYPH|nr:hypothetical protein [Roseibium marinum]POF28046.1 hypothetical protein CLV41_11850 [Roseibium marinum]
MGRFLWLLNTPDGAPKFVSKIGGYTFDIDQQSAFGSRDLSVYDGIVLTMHSDQKHLQSVSSRLETFLEGGGSIVFNGHIAHPFLPGISPFRPIAQEGLESLRIHIEEGHSVFEGLTTDDLTFQRGVAGFYSRGTNPPPEGAEVLTTLGVDRVPVDWIAHIGKGRLFVHTGNDLFSFLHRADPEGLSVLHRFFSHFERSIR